MNILPKKRWHVRTKDNIARVRRDEAEANEKEKQRLEKLKFAESEARINFLRRQTGIPERQHEETSAKHTSSAVTDTTSTSEHIDLFADYKTHIKTTNKDLEKEQKEEREKYEKQIGYLTYLGQDTNEALKLRSWYEVAPKRAKTNCDGETEKDLQKKYTHDPLSLIKALLPADKSTKVSKDNPKTYAKVDYTDNNELNEKKAIPIVHKKHKKEKKAKRKKTKKEKHSKRDRKSTDSYNKKKKSRKNELVYSEQKRQEHKRDLINRLRKERLQREAAERDRQDALLKPPETNTVSVEKKLDSTPRIVQKYNSQFNPELAKQNML